MIELAIASRIARDLTQQQFAPAPSIGLHPPVAAPRVPGGRVSVRRASARTLRMLANRVEPGPRRQLRA